MKERDCVFLLFFFFKPLSSPSVDFLCLQHPLIPSSLTHSFIPNNCHITINTTPAIHSKKENKEEPHNKNMPDVTGVQQQEHTKVCQDLDDLVLEYIALVNDHLTAWTRISTRFQEVIKKPT